MVGANVSQHNPSSATTTVFPAKAGIYVAAHKSRSEKTRQRPPSSLILSLTTDCLGIA